MNGFSGEVTEEGLEKLRDDENVKMVYLNRPVRAFLSDSKNITNASNTWRLVYNSTNLTGKGETVCIIDTGVDYTHPDLGNCAVTSNINDRSCGKVIGGYDFINDDQNPIDDEGHGTHVAGIVASTNQVYRGIAPDANIVAIKSLDEDGGGDTDTVVNGINWCVYNSSIFNITVISMSLGTTTLFNSHCDDSDLGTAEAIDAAIAKNISVIAAAANDGSTTSISSPACIKNATSVGWTNKDNTIASSSNRNNITDLLAPGSSITSTRNGGSFETLSGTSMATPMVAGAFTLIHQYFKITENKRVMPNETWRYLNGTGKQIDDSSGSGLKFSRINIFAAILSLDSIQPAINITFSEHSNNSNTSNKSIFVNVTSTEVLASAKFEINGTNTSMDGSGLKWHINKTLFANGTHHYRIYGADNAGNTGISDKLIFNIINNQPNITSFSPIGTDFSVTEPNNVTFTISANDPDNDAISIFWYKNGTLNSIINNFTFLGNFSSAGFYNITSIVSDGIINSSHYWNFTVNNTNLIPNVVNVTINSTDFLNRTNGTLTANWFFSDLDENIFNTWQANETKWYNNSEEIIGLVNYTSISSNYTKKHQNWTFSVRVFDGMNWSDWVNSSNLTIRNSVPLINITIQNITINESDLADINLSGNLGAVDNDNDTLVFNYSAPLNSSGQWQTNFADARNYTVTINVSDNDNGFDTQQVIIAVLDKVNGENDTITGNITDIKTNVQNLEMRINNISFNSSKTILGEQEINFTDGDITLAVFDFNFTNTTKFSFVDIKINRTKVSGAESLVIKGIDLTSQNKKKMLYLNRTDTSLNSICVKDSEINSIDEMSSDCGSDTKLACDGIATGSFTCTLEGNLYKITGLSHSGLKQISFTRPSDTSESGSSGGGGGGGSGGGGGGGGGSGAFYVCNMEWQCGEWSGCENGVESRDCSFAKVPQHTQSSLCPSLDNAPQTARKCQAAAIEAKTIGETEETAGEINKSQAPPITGFAVADTQGKTKNVIIGSMISLFIIVVGSILYMSFFSGKAKKENFK